jgi:anti-sigma factor RsiW
VKNPLDLLRRQHKPDPRALSAYADGSASPAERAAFEAHVAGCAGCSARLAELQFVRASLASLPDAAAPRSFRLRESDVAKPAHTAPMAGWMRAMPALSAAAVVVFAIVLGTDLATRTSDGDARGSGLAMSATRNESADGAAPDNQFDDSSGRAAGETQSGSPAVPGALAATPAAEGAENAPAADAATQGDAAPGEDTAASREQIAEQTRTAEREKLEAASQRASSDDDGNQAAFRVVEIAAAAVAVAAGVAAIGIWRRKREMAH